MSEWQRQAAQMLPEVWKDEDARESAYLFFFELLPFVRDGHRAGEEDALDRAYDFALWCHRQSGALGNAVGVAFYEHLFDSFDVHEDVLKRLHPQVINDIWPLWEQRLDETKLRALRARVDATR